MILRRYIQDKKSHGEIAQELGVSEETISRRKNRAMGLITVAMFPILVEVWGE